MSFYAKLAAFWIAVYAALWLLSRFPNSAVGRLAFSWYGPAPAVGEAKSRYLWRWAVYAVSWLAQILVVFAVGVLLLWWWPWLEQEMVFMAFWSFALPLLAGTALLGAVLAVLGALKASLFGPNPVFTADEQGISV